MKIAIHNIAKPRRDGKRNAKEYPYFNELISLLQADGHEIKTTPEFMTWKQMKELADWCHIGIDTDSFWQHTLWYFKKKCIVIFSRSNPEIFGHKEHINLLKDEKHLRPDQFGIWESCDFIEDAFVKPEEIIDEINKLCGFKIIGKI